MLSGVLRESRAARVTHTIVHVEGPQVKTEYHLHLSGSMGDSSSVVDKSLAISLHLPDDISQIGSVTLNGQVVLEKENAVDNDSLCYVALPKGADTNALATIFARMAANRRDLISYEEMRKTHRSASANSAWGVLINIPLGACADDTLAVSIITTGSSNDRNSFGELWFPVCSGLLLLPSGSPATRQPIEHQKHRITVHTDEGLCSGDRQVKPNGSVMFESSWLNPRACGIYTLPEHVQFTCARSTFEAYVPAPLLDRAEACLNSVVSEIVQVLAPWFASPAQLLPPISLVFVPLPQSGSYMVQGNLLVLDEGIFLFEKGLPEKQIFATSLLAEAIASLWIARVFPTFSDPWIPAGLAAMFAERFVSFHFGVNEAAFRLEARRTKLHNMVERGLDWRPLCVIGEDSDPIMRIKSGLVMECLVQSVVGEAEMRNALHELGHANKSVDTDAFFYLLVCTVGQHTEAGRALTPFCREWVRGVGVPLIHVGFTMVDKKRFLLCASQRPLQRINAHDNVLLTSGTRSRGGAVCACGQDFVARKDEGNQVSYMRQQALWQGKRRFWPGDLEVSIFRSSVAKVTASISMSVDDATHSTMLTVPFVTPRKHELVLNRNTREDELVHGWLAVADTRWMLAKIVMCQSALMWSNQLQWSRSLSQELAAVEALQHVRGSALICELLRDVMTGPAYNFRVRQEAGKALIHLAIGCGEREAGEFVIRWLSGTKMLNVKVQDYLTMASVSEQLAYARRSMDRRDHAPLSDALLSIVRAIEFALTTNTTWNVNPEHALAKALKLAVIAQSKDITEVAAVWLRSDQYGPPLASRDFVVTEALLGMNVLPELNNRTLLEGLAQTKHNRRLRKTAIRTYLEAGQSSEESWHFRLSWIGKLTEQICTKVFTDHQALCWLVDCWELVLERMRRDHSKSPLHLLVQKKETCDMLWSYLTCEIPLLPVVVRPHIEACVHAIYFQAYGTSLPGPYRSDEDVSKSKYGAAGPLSFWLPFGEHEKIYRKFLLRGTTVKAEPPPPPPIKKPRLLITGQGSVSLMKTADGV